MHGRAMPSCQKSRSSRAQPPRRSTTSERSSIVCLPPRPLRQFISPSCLMGVSRWSQASAFTQSPRSTARPRSPMTWPPLTGTAESPKQHVGRHRLGASRQRAGIASRQRRSCSMPGHSASLSVAATSARASFVTSDSSGIYQQTTGSILCCPARWQVRPNRSFNRTANGRAPWPRGAFGSSCTARPRRPPAGGRLTLR
jgi:hypothetical protein